MEWAILAIFFALMFLLMGFAIARGVGVYERLRLEFELSESRARVKALSELLNACQRENRTLRSGGE